MRNSFHISYFHVRWSVVIRWCVILPVLSCQKTTMEDLRYQSLKPWKVDNIDLTHQFSLSVLTDFRYQSIKITWLLPIFIDWLLRAVLNSWLVGAFTSHKSLRSQPSVVRKGREDKIKEETRKRFLTCLPFFSFVFLCGRLRKQYFRWKSADLKTNFDGKRLTQGYSTYGGSY